MKKIYLAAILAVCLPTLALAAPIGVGANVNTNVNTGPSIQSQIMATPVVDPGFVWGFYRPDMTFATVPYIITFTCAGGCDGNYIHDMLVNKFDPSTGAFAGTGVYQGDPIDYTWIVNGTTTVNSDATGGITFHIVYTGANAGYTVDAAGMIENDGSLSGTATSNAGQTFTWTIAQKAKPIATFVDASSCIGFSGFKNVTVVGSSTIKTLNDPDVTLSGRVWANDAFNWDLKVVRIGLSTSTQYCGIVHFVGAYTTPTGTEPGPYEPVSGNIIGKTTGDFIGSEIFSFNADSIVASPNWNDIWGWMGDNFVNSSVSSQNQVWDYAHKSHTQQWIETYAPDQGWLNYGNITNP